MEAAGGHATVRRPSFECPARTWRKRRHLAQARRFQLRVQAALPTELAPAGGNYPFPHRDRRLAARFRGERLEGDSAHRNLEVDPVEERSGQPAAIGVDGAWRCAD